MTLICEHESPFQNMLKSRLECVPVDTIPPQKTWHVAGSSATESSALSPNINPNQIKPNQSINQSLGCIPLWHGYLFTVLGCSADTDHSFLLLLLSPVGLVHARANQRECCCQPPSSGSSLFSLTYPPSSGSSLGKAGMIRRCSTTGPTKNTHMRRP